MRANKQSVINKFLELRNYSRMNFSQQMLLKITYI